jgi:hypothetical protein
MEHRRRRRRQEKVTLRSSRHSLWCRSSVGRGTTGVFTLALSALTGSSSRGEQIMSPKRIALGIIPVVALLAASGASGKTLSAFLSADSSVPSGASGQDCANDGETNPEIYAEAETIDTCEDTFFTTSYVNGTTQQGITIPNTCPVTQHFAVLADDPVATIPGSGRAYCTAKNLDPSKCWDTNVNTGQCLSACSAVVNSRFLAKSGPSGCANRQWTAYSIGGP